jgi:hypothetical protein
MSLTDGAPARLTALNACLRPFKPDVLHIWQLKTLWHLFPDVEHLWDDDVELHPFTTMDITPATPIAQCSSDIQRTTAELLNWRRDFDAARKMKTDELEKFWLRKTQKPVLAIVMTRKSPNVQPAFFRGINVEVSSYALFAFARLTGCLLCFLLNFQCLLFLLHFIL